MHPMSALSSTGMDALQHKSFRGRTARHLLSQSGAVPGPKDTGTTVDMNLWAHQRLSHHTRRYLTEHTMQEHGAMSQTASTGAFHFAFHAVTDSSKVVICLPGKFSNMTCIFTLDKPPARPSPVRNARQHSHVNIGRYPSLSSCPCSRL